MSKIAPALQKKWDMISGKKYADQCKWMLNGFWDKLGNDAEEIWKWCQTFSELDPEAKADGHELDEFWSHKFLETLGETMTVIEMREKFRKIDADFNKKMSIIEYIMYRYSLPVESVINAPQGENKEGVARAQKMVDEAQKAVDDMNVKLEESKKAAAAAKVAAEKAAKAAADAKAAEEENKKALEELQMQEKAYEDKKAELTKIKSDMSIGVVKRNRAANELDQLLSEDPLPLRKAKITQSATLKKSEKAAAAAQAAKEKADAEAAAADAAEQAVAAAVAEAEKKFKEAIDFLEAEKMKGGIAQGDIWWMEREITEKKKYLPKSRR